MGSFRPGVRTASGAAVEWALAGLLVLMANGCMDAQAPSAPAKTEGERKREIETLAREVDATEFSKECVRRCLKYPDDANFGFWTEPEIRRNAEGDAFYISSTVKAKNAFGAELTSRWQTIVMLDGDTWKVGKCAIDGRTMCESREVLQKLEARIKPAIVEKKTVSTPAENPAKTRTAAVVREKPKPQYRMWTNATGEHEMEAAFKGMAFRRVKLEKRDGTEVVVPIEKLSDPDQEWIKDRRR